MSAPSRFILLSISAPGMTAQSPWENFDLISPQKALLSGESIQQAGNKLPQGIYTAN